MDNNDFLDEAPTDPYLAITAQLNSASSVVGEFSARAGALGYRTEPDRSWIEVLMDEIADDVDLIAIEDADIYDEEMA